MVKKRLQYRYDAVGNRSLLVDPDGGRFTYAYDSLNQISHLENPQSERTTYAYDANGRRTLKRMANGTRASFTYDDASNLTRVADIKSDGTTITSFDYQYDKTGNRTSVLENDASRVTWTYDNTYQLLSEHRTGSNGYRNTFAYDPAGNRTLKNESGQRTTYAYDAANELETARDASGVTTYTFDADGNQRLVQAPSGDRTTTVWDYENRTTLVQLASSVRNTMAYHPDGLRTQLEDSTGTRKFIWDEQNYLAETDANDDTQVVYTNEPAFYGNLISQRRGSTTNWYHFDAIGSTRALTLTSEADSDTYLYDAWGVPIASTGGTVNPFRYVGQLGYYFDTDSQNNYVRARIFQPLIARWTSLDAFLFLTGLHSFHYAGNAPVSLADPSGLIVVRTNVHERHNVAANAPCPEYGKRNVFLRAKSTFSATKQELAAARRKARPPKRNIAFLQVVTYEVSLAIGASEHFTCDGTDCECKKFTLEYSASFLETIPVGKRDNHSARADQQYLKMLTSKCGPLVPNWCCPWSFSYKVTKRVTLGPAAGGNRSYDRKATAVYECDGQQITDNNPEMPGVTPDPGRAMVEFPDPAITDVWESDELSLTLEHEQCGKLTGKVSPPKYKKV